MLAPASRAVAPGPRRVNVRNVAVRVATPDAPSLTGLSGLKTVIAKQHSAAASQWLANGVAEHTWLQQFIALRDETLEGVRQVIPGVAPAATQLSDPSGVLAVPSLDGEAAFELRTYAAQDPKLLRWIFTSLGLFKPTPARPFGTSLVKIMVGLPTTGPPTPDFGVEMGSLLGAMTPGTTPPKLLCFIALPPRLDPVVHTPYAVRYYTAVPPAAEGSEPLLSFDALQARVTQRVTEGLYLSHYRSPSILTRVLDASSLGFMFDPSRPESVAAVREEVRDALALWGAWRQHDLREAAGEAQVAPGTPPLAPFMTDAVQRELAVRTMALANYMEADPDSGRVAFMFGADGMRAMFDTCSGQAINRH